MKNLKIILILLTILFVSGCSFNEKDNTDSIKFKEEYEKYNGQTTEYGKYPEVDIDEDNVIKYLSLKKVIDIIDNKESAVIYFGYPECPWCRNAVPVLLDAASSTDLDNIYYVNMDGKRDILELGDNNEIVTTTKASADYYTLLEKLSLILLDYELEDESGNKYTTGEKRIYVPLVLFISKGEVVDYHMDTVSTQKDPYISLTDDEYEQLYNIYLTGIHKVLGDVCDEKCDE